MSVLTEEMVEMAARAAYERRNKGLKNVWGWEDHGLDDEHPGTRERFLAEARAALAAVTPIIAAQERERCAKVADARHDGNKADAQIVCMARPINAPLLFNHQTRYDEAAHIAAAIRALGDAT